MSRCAPCGARMCAGRSRGKTFLMPCMVLRVKAAVCSLQPTRCSLTMAVVTAARQGCLRHCVKTGQLVGATIAVRSVGWSAAMSSNQGMPGAQGALQLPRLAGTIMEADAVALQHRMRTVWKMSRCAPRGLNSSSCCRTPASPPPHFADRVSVHGSAGSARATGPCILAPQAGGETQAAALLDVMSLSGARRSSSLISSKSTPAGGLWCLHAHLWRLTQCDRKSHADKPGAGAILHNTVAMDAGGSFNQPKPSTDVLHKFQDQQKWWQTQQAQRGFVHLTGK
jgi:hypothetical protein